MEKASTGGGTRALWTRDRVKRLEFKCPLMAGFSVPWGVAENVGLGRPGGGSGIRTHDTVSRIHAFQASAFSHSAIPPSLACRRTRMPGSACALRALARQRTNGGGAALPSGARTIVKAPCLASDQGRAGRPAREPVAPSKAHRNGRVGGAIELLRGTE